MESTDDITVQLNLNGFERHELGEGMTFWVGQLPAALMRNVSFEMLWELHPQEFHEIKMHGRLVKTPRWQQAFGIDYHYTGRVNKALRVPPVLEPFLHWAKENVGSFLNGMLLNWYDGQLGHYIGRHRDSIENLIAGTPIVTISLGEERTFRLRHWRAPRGAAPIDFPARNGTVFVTPWETNRAFTHEVPHSRRKTGRRISITLRAFARFTAAGKS